MITITEIKSFKCPGETSLKIDFDYNQNIIDVLKQTGCALWHKKQLFWEIPTSMLAFLIDSLTFIDDIEINLLQEQKEEELNITLKHKSKLFDYQEQGVKYMLNNKNCLLLDVPGLGKSIQTIYLAEELKAQKNYEHCLIICGINSLKNNWKKEIIKHSTEDCIIIGEKINSKGNISYTSIKERAEQLYQPIKEFFVILNVESLRDSLIIDAIINSKNKFDLILCDEVHKLGNPSALQTKNFLKLAKVGERHVAMTGTLLTNSPLNAYSPLKFIGKENSTWTNFKNFYCNYEQVFGHMQIAGYKNIEYLKDEIDSCSIRRDKSMLDLPPKTIIPEFIDMNTDQKKFYDDLVKGVTEEADRVNISEGSLLGLVVRLRQATSCPSLLTSKDILPSKIERAIDLVDEIISQGEKVVIFSTFKEPVYLLVEKLKKYNPLVGTGDIQDKVVSDNIDKFQNDDKYKVFIGTSQKMGTGITLTAANYMILIDTEWTWANFEQVTDRIHRIGSNKPVFIYNLICNNTIDERVWNIINRKKDIADYVIDNKINNIDELRELLGL